MRTIGRSRVLLAAIAACLLLAGCGAGPTQAGSAAIIGDRMIPLGEVQDELQWLLHNDPEAKQQHEQGKFGLVSRQTMQSRITHELVRIAAQREGLVADQARVQELIQSSGGAEALAKEVNVRPSRVVEFVTDYVLMEELARHYRDRLTVNYVGGVVTTQQEKPGSTARDQALELGRKIAAEPDRAAELLREAGLQVEDSRQSPGGGALATTMQEAPGLAASAVFGTRPGTVVIAQAGQQATGWLVVLIRDRTVGPPSGEPPAQTDQSQAQVLPAVGLRMLQPIADELGIKVNPRYGVWNPIGMQLEASEAELTGHLIPVGPITKP